MQPLQGYFTRADVVFHHYKPDSIKSVTRKRSSATHRKQSRRKIDSSEVAQPSQWESFIHLPENKSDITAFLSCELIKRGAKDDNGERNITTASGFQDLESVESSIGQASTPLKSDQEEADTSSILHTLDAARSGFDRILVYCRDNDVLVLLIHIYEVISAQEWMCAGTKKKKKKFTPVHSIYQTLAQDVRRNLPTFYSLTGCDSISQFAGYGKNSTWKIFLQSPSLLARLGHDNHLSEDRISYVEEFVVKLYMPASDLTSIDAVRARLFRQKSPEALPPTHDAFVQHRLQINYQALIWYKCIESTPELPSAQDS